MVIINLIIHIIYIFINYIASDKIPSSAMANWRLPLTNIVVFGGLKNWSRFATSKEYSAANPIKMSANVTFPVMPHHFV